MLLFFIFIVVKNIGAVDSSITPDQTIISSSEGSIITLTCTYDDSAYNLYWYRQKPHSEPEFLLLIPKSSDSVTKAAHAKSQVLVEMKMVAPLQTLTVLPHVH
ncbi:hypothetical protein QTP70_019401 [Hemibagrus guttatus]|uniref:Ig-like domain-containing protein n=1 Tax=Hemibagrus guttatus TaxID=175788 RepID=A0AAE0VB80_9TELE|nr:hypothetical protein QTP70_019401 [Hemibagrus guttatus]